MTDITNLRKEYKKVFNELHDTNNNGIISAIVQEIQTYAGCLYNDQRANQIQKITNDEKQTQKIMDELFGSYGKYLPTRKVTN